MVWCEHLEKTAAAMRAVARRPKEVDRLLKKGLHALDQAAGVTSLRKAGREAIEALRSIKKNEGPPLKVLMVGELYTVLEPSINMDVERRLGRLGVEVHRSAFFSTHIRRGSRMDRKLLKEREKLLHAAKPYFNYDVGAECNFSVAETILAADQGYNGVVHVYPFSCMPESNAATMLSALGPDFDIPILPMAID
ncbi:MAG: hypothetical protein GY849_15090, partial [Deltaproteobacteria bacterium]|nr:hypothetical protein [Deltaproteobacteria bacterium]